VVFNGGTCDSETRYWISYGNETSRKNVPKWAWNSQNHESSKSWRSLYSISALCNETHTRKIKIWTKSVGRYFSSRKTLRKCNIAYVRWRKVTLRKWVPLGRRTYGDRSGFNDVE